MNKLFGSVNFDIRFSVLVKGTMIFFVLFYVLAAGFGAMIGIGWESAENKWGPGWGPNGGDENGPAFLVQFGFAISVMRVAVCAVLLRLVYQLLPSLGFLPNSLSKVNGVDRDERLRYIWMIAFLFFLISISTILLGFVLFEYMENIGDFLAVFFWNALRVFIEIILAMFFFMLRDCRIYAARIFGHLSVGPKVICLGFLFMFCALCLGLVTAQIAPSLFVSNALSFLRMDMFLESIICVFWLGLLSGMVGVILLDKQLQRE